MFNNFDPNIGAIERAVKVLITTQRESVIAISLKRVPLMPPMNNKGAKVAKIIILASPNNPTSNSASIDTIKRLLKTDKLVIVDEAYFEFGGI